MLSRLIRAAGATIVALATLIAAPAFANNKTVNGITVETTLTQITRGQSYSYQIAPSGPGAYAGTYSFSQIGGALPAGISVSSTGLVSGTTCDSNGNNKFDLRISTNGPPATTADFSGNSNGMTVNVTTSGSGVCDLTLTGTTPNGTVGVAYSGASFSPSGGTSPYSYSLFSGALPPGLTLASNGTISGTPTTAGTYTFVVNATDAILRAGQATFSITIAPAAPVTVVVNPATLPNAQTTVAYSQTMTGSGGTAPYSFALSAGSLPLGMGLSSAGALTGTPVAAGTYNFTIRATDAGSNSGTRAYTFVVAGSNTLTIAPATLPGATKSTAYNQTVSASPGAGPFNYSITTGALPAGLSISAGGAITGTPTASGTFNFTVYAQDPNGNFGSRAYTLVVAPATIIVSPATLPNASNGVAYSQAFGATGGVAPHTFAVTAGVLPAGLTLMPNGALSGTPTAIAGSYNFTVTATDAVSDTGARAYTLVVDPASITVSPSSLSDVASGTPVNTTFTATGGTGPYTYSTTGSLPPGITMSTGGTLSGSSTAPGTYTFDVTVTDANGDTKTVTISLTILAAPLTIDPPTLPNAKNGSAYSVSLVGAGGTGVYTFTVDGGSALPNGLTLAADGTLSGVPGTAAGSYTFTISLSDAVQTTTRTYTLVVDPANMGIAPAFMPQANIGVAYSQQMFTTGGTSPYVYTITAGALPPGVTLAGDTLQGTPTATGTFNFTVTATDANGDTAIKGYSIEVLGSTVTVDPTTLPGGANSTAYSATFTASGGTAPYTYASTGTLPTGLSLSGDTLSGTPTAAGSYTFTITATDAFAQTGSRAYTVVIAAATLAITPASLPGATNGVAYSQTLNTTGGTAPYAYSSTTLPSGLVLSTGGVLSGTPNVAAGSYTFDVTVTDANGDTTTVSYTLVVGAATLNISPASLPGATNGAAYSQALSTTGGTAPYSYTSSALPTGLVLSGGGVISGTPNAVATSYPLNVTVTDANGDTASASYTLVVGAASIVVTPASLPNGTNSTAYSQTVSASGGTAPYAYSVAGTLPTGLSFSGDTLSGTPTTAGSYSFTVTATDANGDTGSQAYTVTIASATLAITPATLPGAKNGTAYSQAFSASGGTPTYTYAVTGGTMPTGLALSPGGALSGTPSCAATTYNITVTATDANGDTASMAYAIVVDPASIAIAPGTLPHAANGAAYSQALAATGGAAPYDFALASGALPAGMSMSTAGVLAGTPGVAAGAFDFTVTATDANGDVETQAYTLVVGSATIAVTPASLPNSKNGTAYSQDFAATGGTGPYTYALVGGTLPKGLALAGGKLSGTPSAAGTFDFTVEATDANGDKGNRAYAVSIAAATIDIAPGTLAHGTNGAAFAQTFTATGGTGPYAFGLKSGALPTGLALASNGELTGTPHAAGNFTFTVETTDANGDKATRAYTLTVAGGNLLTVDPETLPGATAADAYAQTLTAIGGAGPYTFAITEGALPEGLVLAADGKITGTPTTAGDATFTVTATDKDGNFGTRIYTLAIADAIVLDITPGTLEEGHGGSPYSATFGATGGTAPYTFSVSEGALPAGMTLATDGTLSGTPTTPGTYTFTVRGEDSLGHAGTRAVTLIIGAALRGDPTRDPSVIDNVNEQLGAARRQGELQMSHVFRRLDAPRAPCSASEGDTNETCKQPVEVWATGTRETSYASGTSVVGAFTVGADMQMGGFRFGAALGTGWDLSERASGYRGDVDGKTFMLYGRMALGKTFGLAAVGGRTDLDMDARRALGDAGAVIGSRDGTNTFVGVELSGEWGNGERGLIPYLRYEHARTELDGYAESATSPLALQYGDVSQRNSAFVVGAEAFHVLRFDWGTLTPKVRVEVRDRNGASVDQAMWYLDAPASPYVLAVRGVDERSALAAFGLEAAFGNVRLTFEYGTAGSAEDLFEGQALRLQLRADF